MTKSISLYIHIPFCKSKCHYCDFNSYSGIENLIEDYFAALTKEAQKYADQLKDYSIKSIFFGGGTPSYVASEYISELLIKCHESMDFDENIEITIEANPGTLDEEKLIRYRDSGINRLSMGLQACQNHLLSEIGRIHKLEDFDRNLEIARRCGFDNISADLIFGLPGQQLNEWHETLDYIINKKLEHISCYSLKVEEGTILDKKMSEGIISAFDEELDRIMYHKAVEKLELNGYIHYEISNFALKGYESRHNIAYWIMQDYIGLGAGAHSYFKSKRYNNIYDIKKYTDGLFYNKDIIEEICEIDISTEVSEYIIMGLRMIKGININTLYDKYNFDIYEKHGDTIRKLTGRGLLKVSNGYMMLTPLGLDLANQVMVEFL